MFEIRIEGLDEVSGAWSGCLARLSESWTASSDLLKLKAKAPCGSPRPVQNTMCRGERPA